MQKLGKNVLNESKNNYDFLLSSLKIDKKNGIINFYRMNGIGEIVRQDLAEEGKIYSI